ncbi:MFS transporter [Martelella endophytica]|uniref:MFS transporter n=1 Tax=Martelella endophytica TaxID=1486262 RepID=A0A0D5LSB4_MAREN|nr:MFS transporter [Martelella endophytica]AJY46263.1 MFS transporter [Martelella endophytica]
MSPAMTLLFAVAGGIAVGNLYWAQPLLADIAEKTGVATGTASLLVTVTQIGYALGILLFVPLGDVLNRRRVIPVAMALSAIALAAAAFAPGFAPLAVALAAVGLLTTGGQMLPPLAGALATPDQRGRVLGTVASGMLTGILVSRTVAGFLAEAFGWRAVFAIAAFATLLMAALLARLVPHLESQTQISYPKLLASVFTAIRDYAVVRTTLVMGACTFGVFSLFWTGLTFLLTDEPYNYSLSQIGLVGLAGLAGALAAKNAGRLHDKGLAVGAQGIAFLVTLACLLVAALWSTSILVIIAIVIVLDAAIQSVNVLNQIRLISVGPEARSRMNSAFVTSNFIGGAIGSALAGAVWPAAGWTGLMIAAGVLILIASFFWLTGRPAFSKLAAA